MVFFACSTEFKLQWSGNHVNMKWRSQYILVLYFDFDLGGGGGGGGDEI